MLREKNTVLLKMLGSVSKVVLLAVFGEEFDGVTARSESRVSYEQEVKLGA